jgi:hypothetical protein
MPYREAVSRCKRTIAPAIHRTVGEMEDNGPDLAVADRIDALDAHIYAIRFPFVPPDAALPIDTPDIIKASASIGKVQREWVLRPLGVFINQYTKLLTKWSIPLDNPFAV